MNSPDKRNPTSQADAPGFQPQDAKEMCATPAGRTACNSFALNDLETKDNEELERHGLLTEITRRRFVQASSAVAASLAFGLPAFAEPPEPGATIPVQLTINGKPHSLDLDPRTSLLDALRENLDMTGTKKGCDHGQCGACTVLMDGRRVNSCLTLACAAEGAEITTIEGLAKPADRNDGRGSEPGAGGIPDARRLSMRVLHTRADYLGNGADSASSERGELSIVSWRTAHSTHPELTDDEIRERMSGNICRCGAYPNIVAAVRAAAKGASA